MTSDEWKKFLVETFNEDEEGDVVTSLEGLSLQQIHGLLGLIERRLFIHTQERLHNKEMSHLEMWKADDIRGLLKKARNGIRVIIGHEAWQENLREGTTNGVE